MKQLVYSYIVNNRHSSVHSISKGLGFEEIDVLKAINELCDDLFIYQEMVVPISVNNDCSCYYSAFMF